MIDIIVNGGIIDDVSVSKGTVIKVDEHSSTIHISSSHALPIGNQSSHSRLWKIGFVFVIITIILGCFMYGIKIICHQSNQIDQMKMEFHERELRFLRVEKELNLLKTSMYTPNEISLDSIDQEYIEISRSEE